MTDQPIEAPAKRKRRKPRQRREGAGRREQKFDIQNCIMMARFGCTDSEIADNLGVSRRTFVRRKADDKRIYRDVQISLGKQPDGNQQIVKLTGTFRELLEAGENIGNVALRRAQFKLAIEGNAQMLVWLGKQRLRQKEAVDVSGDITVKRLIGVDLDRV